MVIIDKEIENLKTVGQLIKALSSYDENTQIECNLEESVTLRQYNWKATGKISTIEIIEYVER